VVFTLKLVRALVNVPVPVPFVVLLLAVVGFVVVLQQTPLAVMAEPPSLVIDPPDEALKQDNPEMDVVEMIIELEEIVVNETCAPYAVPILFVA